MKTWIEARDVTHFFGQKKVLNQISFQIEKGSVTGLLGPSGAGKTTLISILTGQIVPSAGTVKTQERCAVGIMMDSFGLYERLSVWDNLKIYADLYRVPSGKIRELLVKTGMETEKKTPVGKLSKGMRNRVSFCRALLKDVDILFLDEPASGLDPASAGKIHELILQEKQAGTTVFLTTHNMHEAETLCDEVMLLNAGKIVEHGEPGEICMKYNTENKIEVVLKGGEARMLPNSSRGAWQLSEWMREERILSIHSTEPDLEEVFLTVTGRRLTEE